jgi:parallel beta-helix repeat protein
MATINVNSTAGLLAALKSARDGDIILLETGTYSAVTLRGFNFADVTIQSKSPLQPAVLTDLLVKDSSGINFRNLEFAVDPAKPLNSFQIMSSKDIHVDKVNVHGTLNGNPADDKSGLMIRSSSDVSVTNSEFHQLWHGISLLDNDKIVLTGNNFHDIRTDGIRGGGTSNLMISNNSFTDFYPAAGDHPDAIQLWTTNTTETARNIVISDNIVTRGNGAMIQGIFLRDTFDQLPFHDVTITNNLVVGGMYNGISVSGSVNLKLSNNTVVALPDQKSWIRVQNSDLVLSEGNAAEAFVYITSTRVTEIGNQTIARATDGGAGAVTTWRGEEGQASPDAVATPAPVPVQQPAAQPVAPAVEVVPTKFISGTSSADRLTVASGYNSVIEAGAGDDTLTGGAGTNLLIGGAGNDTYLVKRAGDEVREDLDGGTDTVWASIDYVLGANLEILRLADDARSGTGNELNNRIVGTGYADRLSGLDGDDSLQGGAGNDTLLGGSGTDELLGQDGDDELHGEGGADKLIGGAGADRLFGGDGDDWLEGGAGADILSGGLGADKFVFRPEDIADRTVDRITDFSASQGDRIVLSLLDANVHTTQDDKFAFIGTKGFSGTAGQLRYEIKDGGAYVYGDVNGDKIADFTLFVANVSSMAASDFVL